MVIRQLKQKQTPFTIYHLPFTRELARLRTYPQHTLPLLPLLRSRPGGVRKASVVRSPKSDNLSRNRCWSHMLEISTSLETAFFKSVFFSAPTFAAAR